MEYDNLPDDVQEKIQEILWAKCNSTKEVSMGMVEDWIADYGNCDWGVDRWIEEAKGASL